MSVRAAVALAACAVLAASHVAAHSMPYSTVLITPTPAGLEVSALIPLSELEAALNRPVDVATERAALEAYMRGHIGASSLTDAAWTVSVRGMAREAGGEHAILEVGLTLTPPRGASIRRFRFRYDAVTHAVASHYVLVYLRRSGDLLPWGRLQSPATTLTLDLKAR